MQLYKQLPCKSLYLSAVELQSWVSDNRQIWQCQWFWQPSERSSGRIVT